MMNMDETARNSDNLDYCFDDLLCSDLTPSLKAIMSDALQTTLWILDEGQSKYRLQLAVKDLQDQMQHKADKSYVLHLEKELRHSLAHKVDHAEFMQCTAKLASSSELQRLQSLLTDAHGALGTAGFGRTHGHGEGSGVVDLQNSPEFLELISRFDSLTKKYVEIKEYCDKLVPKEEVHEALKAVVEEVKTMRRSFVSTNIFKESLKTKADSAQVEK